MIEYENCINKIMKIKKNNSVFKWKSVAKTFFVTFKNNLACHNRFTDT